MQAFGRTREVTGVVGAFFTIVARELETLYVPCNQAKGATL